MVNGLRVAAVDVGRQLDLPDRVFQCTWSAA